VAKPRSPILGFNHNLHHRGRSFHVQTEDSGLNRSRIFTHLFHEGVIVASKKVEYDPESDAEVVKGLMQAQHKAVLRELKKGVYDPKILGLLGADAAAPAAVISDPTVKAPAPELIELLEDDDQEYAQIIVDDSNNSNASMVAGTLDANEGDDELDVSGAFRRLSSEPRQVTPIPVTVSPATPPRAHTWMLTRTGQQERPFDKTGSNQAAVPTPVPTTIPPPIPTSRSEARRRASTPVMPAPPVKLPEVPTPPPPPLMQRGKRNISPTGPLPSPEVRRPAPPPPLVPSGTGRAVTSPILPVVPPAPRAPATGQPRIKPTESIVVARPAVVIGGPGGPTGGPGTPGGPPTGQERKPARETTPPPESIFGQDLISEKSLDEVIMAYLSEDANDD
jgi:hypothetical protein